MDRTCPTCQRPLEVEGATQNTREALALSVPFAALMSLRHALMIGANTHLMTGEPASKAHLQALLAEVDARLPDVACHFGTESWTVMIQSIQNGRTPEVRLVPRSTWSPDADLALVVAFEDGTTITGKTRGDRAQMEPEKAALEAIIDELRPLS